MEFAFFGFCIKLMPAEVSKYFSNVILMGCEVLGIYKAVIQIDNNTYVKHIGEDAIDKLLEGGWCVDETLRHNQPFIGTIAHLESSLPLISRCNPDEMISRTDVDFCIYFGAARRFYRSDMRGNGYRSFLVLWLKPQKSMQRCKEPSCFLTKRTGAL
jgi:hypothetical protein